MIAIACVDKNNGIGKDGKLLISIPDDMKFFRETTRDNIVVMGRKTLFSFKDKMPLKNRINIVFTNNDNLKDEYKGIDNIYFVKKYEELNDIVKKHPDKKVFIIGGATIYHDLLPFYDTCLITKIYKEFPADSYFPDIEKLGFIKTDESEIHKYEDLEYQFLTYRKILEKDRYINER
ncbi:MAG: dihydrofolate reductase [Lachnospiraceae bacterium]|nr:dihydrofolate reductase [Lachnospiraceae bacterium]